MKWYLCNECGNVWRANENTCPACGDYKNVWDITDMLEYKYLIERAKLDVIRKEFKKVEDALETILENIPPLECPECKSSDADCIQDGLIDVTYPDPSIIHYNYACPKCSKQFTEIFYRAKVEKVGV